MLLETFLLFCCSFPTADSPSQGGFDVAAFALCFGVKI